jgi:hypothetical protein
MMFETKPAKELSTDLYDMKVKILESLEESGIATNELQGKVRPPAVCVRK